MKTTKKHITFVGIDISKKHFDVATYAQKEHGKKFHKRYSMEERSMKECLKDLRKNGLDLNKTLFCSECTGDYGRKLNAFFQKKKIDYWEESPVKIKKSFRILRGKSDQIDAYRIASYAYRYQEEFKPKQPKSLPFRIVVQLLALRMLLVKTTKMLKVFGKEKQACLDRKELGKVPQYVQKLHEMLVSILKEVDADLAEWASKDGGLKRKLDCALSVPNIGLITGISLIVRIDSAGTGRLQAKQLACYAGVAPFEYSSGSSVRGRTQVSTFGDKGLKRKLHMCAMSSVRKMKQPPSFIRSYYERKVEEGKNKMSVLNAVRYKLLSRVVACVRDDRLYTEDYERRAV